MTIKDVATKAGVSIATVSRVLNNSPCVNEETRLRVKAAVDELGYQRNEVARSLKVRSTRSIGILAPEFTNFYFMEVVEAIGRVLAENGYSIIVASSSGSVEQEKLNLQTLIERNVDGLVVMPSGFEGGHFKNKALKNTPIVFLDRKVEGIKTDTVISDNRYGIKEVLKGLASEGHRRIGFIGGDLTFFTAKERYLGYIEGMMELGLNIDETCIFTEGLMLQSDGYEQLKKAFALEDPPNAYVIANDSLHIGCTTYALQNIPIDVRSNLVFGTFDYLSYAPLLRYAHYAAAQRMEEIGIETAQILLKRLGGDMSDFPQVVMLRPEIKVLDFNGGKPFAHHVTAKSGTTPS